MKKLLLILTLSCIAFIVHAQPKKIVGYLYATGGANWATYFQGSKDVPSTKGIWGPEASLSLRTVYPTWIGYEVGGFYSSKGGKFRDSLGTVRMNYVGAYLTGLIFFPLINNDDAYAGAGIYVANAINGKAGEDSLKSDIKFDGETWKSIDMGLQLKAGYVIKNTIGFGVRYDIGLVPAYTGVDLRGNVNRARNSGFNLFVTLNLGKLFQKSFTTY